MDAHWDHEPDSWKNWISVPRTPALSLRERENRRQSCCEGVSMVVGWVHGKPLSGSVPAFCQIAVFTNEPERIWKPQPNFASHYWIWLHRRQTCNRANNCAENSPGSHQIVGLRPT